MEDEEIELLAFKLEAYYRQLGTPIPEEAIFLAKSAIKMGLELESTWAMLEQLLPNSKSIVESIDATIEYITKDNSQEKIFRPADKVEQNDDEEDFENDLGPEDLPDPYDEDIYGRWLDDVEGGTWIPYNDD